MRSLERVGAAREVGDHLEERDHVEPLTGGRGGVEIGMNDETESVASVLRGDVRDLDALAVPACGAGLVEHEAVRAADVEQLPRRTGAHLLETQELCAAR